MANRARQIAGFTLVEMLIVIAIVASLAAISVPFIGKYGALASSDVNTTARELQEILRATQIYASSNNVDAAVAYSLVPRNDSLSGAEGVRVANAVAMVRRLTSEETERLGFGRNAEFYVPVQNQDGVFRLFQAQACLLNMQPRSAQPNLIEPVDMGATVGTTTLAAVDMGLRAINLVDIDGVGVAPAPSMGYPAPASSAFPAHVFEASGRLSVADNVGKQRFMLWVSAFPDAGERDRYVQYSAADGIAVPYAKTLELYRTLGRVKLQL